MTPCCNAVGATIGRESGHSPPAGLYTDVACSPNTKFRPAALRRTAALTWPPEHLSFLVSETHAMLRILRLLLLSQHAHAGLEAGGACLPVYFLPKTCVFQQSVRTCPNAEERKQRFDG